MNKFLNRIQDVVGFVLPAAAVYVGLRMLEARNVMGLGDFITPSG